MSRYARIEIVPAKPGVNHASGKYGYFLRLRASNGRILAHSEVYASKSNARRAAESWLSAMDDCVHPDVTGPIREVTE